MNFIKRCNDRECNLRLHCLRQQFRSGDIAQISHGVDEDGWHYCNYHITEKDDVKKAARVINKLNR